MTDVIQRSHDYEAGEIVTAQIDTGWYYECIQGGRTAMRYPGSWPRMEGVTVDDGSVVWMARHPDNVEVEE